MIRVKGIRFLKFVLYILIVFWFSGIIFKIAYCEQVIRMQEMVVKGRVQKPQAMYILQRSTHVTFATSIKNKREDFRLYILDAIRENRDLFTPELEKK